MHLSKNIPLPTETSESKWQSLTLSLVKMIVIVGLPFSLVDNPAFRWFLQKLNPRYIPPKKTTVREWTNKIYDTASKVVKEKISSNRPYALITDAWTGANGIHSEAVAFSSLTENWEPIFCVLSGGVTTDPNGFGAESISDAVDDAMEFGKLLPKFCSAVVVDTTSVNRAAAALPVGKDSEARPVLWWWCFDHLLHLAIKGKAKTDQLKCGVLNLAATVAPFNAVVDRVRKVCAYFRHSPKASLVLQQAAPQGGQSPKAKLPIDVVTRWLSCYVMLKTVVKLWATILVSVTNIALGIGISRKNLPPTVLPQDKPVLDALCDCLHQPMLLCKSFQSSSYVTISHVIPSVTLLVDSLAKPVVGTGVAQKTKNDFNKLLLERIKHRYDELLDWADVTYSRDWDQEHGWILIWFSRHFSTRFGLFSCLPGSTLQRWVVGCGVEEKSSLAASANFIKFICQP